MVGAGVTQNSKKKANNSSDIVANFHSSSCMSQIELNLIFQQCNELLIDITENKSKESRAKLLKLFDEVEMQDRDEHYPDIFKELFKELCERPG